MNELLHCARPGHTISLRTWINVDGAEREVQRIAWRLGDDGAVVSVRAWSPGPDGTLVELPAETPAPEIPLANRAPSTFPIGQDGLSLLGVVWPTHRATTAEVSYERDRLHQIRLRAEDHLLGVITIDYAGSLPQRATEIVEGETVLELHLAYDASGDVRERTVHAQGERLVDRRYEYVGGRLAREHLHARDGTTTDVEYAYTMNEFGDWIRRDATTTANGQTVRGASLIREIEYLPQVPAGPLFGDDRS